MKTWIRIAFFSFKLVRTINICLMWWLLVKYQWRHMRISRPLQKSRHFPKLERILSIKPWPPLLSAPFHFHGWLETDLIRRWWGSSEDSLNSLLYRGQARLRGWGCWASSTQNISSKHGETVAQCWIIS